jgi:hypothetical protein
MGAALYEAEPWLAGKSPGHAKSMHVSVAPFLFLHILTTRSQVDYSANHGPIQEFEFYLREQADRLRWLDNSINNDNVFPGHTLPDGLIGLPTSDFGIISDGLLALPDSSNAHPPLVLSDGEQNAGDITQGLISAERAHVDTIMHAPPTLHDNVTANVPLVLTDRVNLCSSPNSSFMPSSVDASESSLTSLSHNPQEETKICRCKLHTDACDRSQFAHGAEKCITCHRHFLWTANALHCIVLTTENDFLCRCKWHNRACRRLQDDYDSRKCDCCRGWLAFSEQANKLISTPVGNEHVEAQSDFSEFFEFGRVVDT